MLDGGSLAHGEAAELDVGVIGMDVASAAVAAEELAPHPEQVAEVGVEAEPPDGAAEEGAGAAAELEQSGDDNGGHVKLVLYTTSVAVVRKTFEQCRAVKQMLEAYGVEIDERDVSMHAGFRDELKARLGGALAPVPQLFLGPDHVGGHDEIQRLNEAGKLKFALADVARRGKVTILVQHAVIWQQQFRDVAGHHFDLLILRCGATSCQACGACGGVRFVICTACDGSRKVVGDDGSVEECVGCNERGLMRCPLCTA
eukprot:SM000719S21280  [mRNA]  locus=s719:1075:2254:- [translate_table: standard]